MNDELIPHLFRTEFSRIVSVLTRKFGLAHMEAAEDIASETFMLAVETWPYKGIPGNPTAWLYTVAGNKAKNHLHRNRIFQEKVAEHLVTAEFTDYDEVDLSEHHIKDSQLQMLFAVCHPSISPESQIGLALRILCGFGILEIANAFLTNSETINKRLFRAREQLRNQKVQIEFPSDNEVNARLDAVLTTLYLLFNEGYYSESNDNILREDLCLEAMRLTDLLLQNSKTNLPRVSALYALMCFHSSRFAARKGGNGEIILYDDQDESLWDRDLITKGVHYLRNGAQGNELSKYHFEASIAYWHTVKEDAQEKWENILQLYNQLLQLEYSPIAAMNRTYALAKARGTAVAIPEVEKLNLNNNHFYFVLLGELYKNVDKTKAKESLDVALSLAKSSADRVTIQRKISEFSM